VDPRAGLDDAKRKFLALPGLELRPLSRAARSFRFGKAIFFSNAVLNETERHILPLYIRYNAVCVRECVRS
jgi:hypothetical protein